MVEEQERVGEREVGAREGAADLEALALELTVGGDDLHHAAPAVRRRQGSRRGRVRVSAVTAGIDASSEA